MQFRRSVQRPIARAGRGTRFQQWHLRFSPGLACAEVSALLTFPVWCHSSMASVAGYFAFFV